MRIFLIFIFLLLKIQTNAYADRVGLFILDMSKAKYSDEDVSDIVLEGDPPQKSFSGGEVVFFNSRSGERRGLEYRERQFQNNENSNLLLNHSTKEILWKHGYAWPGERRGGISFVGKYFLGYGVSEFNFYNKTESRESDEAKQTLDDLQPLFNRTGLELSIETLVTYIYFEFGIRWYIPLDGSYPMKIKYQNNEEGQISYDPMFFITLGFKEKK